MALETMERFTCFGFDDSSKFCQMTTFNKSMMRKMDKYCKDFPKEFKKVSDQIFDNILEGKEYEFDKKYISIRPPRAKKEMTEEQKLKVANRLKKARSKKEV